MTKFNYICTELYIQIRYISTKYHDICTNDNMKIKFHPVKTYLIKHNVTASSTITFSYNCLYYFILFIHSVANILVKPIQADSTVCPTPQNRAYNGSIEKLDAR